MAAAYLTLTGNLVNTAIARAGYAAQIDTTRTLIAVVREQVDITHAQVEAGAVRHASELSMAAQLAALEASLPPLEHKRDQAEHLEATLMGQYPMLEHDAAQVDAQARAQEAARVALEELQAGYRAGTASYLQVLTGDAQFQQAAIGCLQARAQRLQDTVALFVALGGGWRNVAPPVEGTAAQR